MSSGSFSSITPSVKCNAFWERILCSNWPQVDLHIIMPTVLKTIACKTRPQDLRVCKSQDEVDSLKFHLLCCICEADLSDKLAHVGVRCLMYKMETKLDKRDSCFVYRTSFMSTHFCESCGKRNCCFKVGLDSDHLMINTLLDQFERASFDLVMDLNTVDMEPYHFFRCIILRMSVTRFDLLKSLGQLENKCTFCKRAKAKNNCGKCFLYSYCNAKCAKKDAAKHEKECLFLQTHALFGLKEKSHLIIKK